jgi:hypothetical protein
VVVIAGTTGMKLMNYRHDEKLNDLLTEKVNSRFEAKGLLVKLHVEQYEGTGPNGEGGTNRCFRAYTRADLSTQVVENLSANQRKIRVG